MRAYVHGEGGDVMRRALCAGCATAALAFAAAVVFDVLLFGNYAAVPPHSACALASAAIAALAWLMGEGRRGGE